MVWGQEELAVKTQHSLKGADVYRAERALWMAVLNCKVCAQIQLLGSSLCWLNKSMALDIQTVPMQISFVCRDDLQQHRVDSEVSHMHLRNWYDFKATNPSSSIQIFFFDFLIKSGIQRRDKCLHSTTNIEKPLLSGDLVQKAPEISLWLS